MIIINLKGVMLVTQMLNNISVEIVKSKVNCKYPL